MTNYEIIYLCLFCYWIFKKINFHFEIGSFKKYFSFHFSFIRNLQSWEKIMAKNLPSAYIDLNELK